MATLALIPARGGSKRIPGKNIRPFRGKPIISYPLEAARQSQLFDRIIVSTDDEKIARTATLYGGEVPFMRSAKNADDFAGTDDVVAEVLVELSQRGERFDRVCCIYPTAPLVTAELLVRARDLMDQKDFDAVFPVTPFSYPVQRGLKMGDQGRISMVWPEHRDTRSQDLSPILHDAGQFYWIKTQIFLKTRTLWPENTGAIKLSNLEVQDIDNESDWQLAEIKYDLLQKNNPPIP